MCLGSAVASATTAAASTVGASASAPVPVHWAGVSRAHGSLLRWVSVGIAFASCVPFPVFVVGHGCPRMQRNVVLKLRAQGGPVGKTPATALSNHAKPCHGAKGTLVWKSCNIPSKTPGLHASLTTGIAHLERRQIKKQGGEVRL
jgi:hypothetical protein